MDSVWATVAERMVPMLAKKPASAINPVLREGLVLRKRKAEAKRVATIMVAETVQEGSELMERPSREEKRRGVSHAQYTQAQTNPRPRCFGLIES